MGIGTLALEVFVHAVLALFAIGSVFAAPPAAMPDRGAIFHLADGPDDPHDVIHPLVRASKMSKAGFGVLVYLDVDAAPLAFAGASSVVFKDHDSTKLLQAILANGGKVAVCGECMEAHSKSASDLLEGATVATPDLFFTVGEKTVTFDY